MSTLITHRPATLSVPPGPSWSAVEFRHLAALVAVADTGSFSAAGKRLGYAQSTVSQQIAALERLAGIRLIERTRGPSPVALTSAGSRLLGDAEQVLGRITNAFAEIRAAAESGRPPRAPVVRVAVDTLVADYVLPKIVHQLSRPHRKTIAVAAVRVEHEQRRAAMLTDGTVDIAILTAVTPPLDGTIVLHDPYLLALDATHPVATKPEPLTHDDLRRVGALQPNHPHTHAPTNHTQALLWPQIRDSLLHNGAGAIVTQLMLTERDPHDAATTVRNVQHLYPPRALYACWRSRCARTPQIAEFRNATTEYGIRQTSSEVTCAA